MYQQLDLTKLSDKELQVLFHFIEKEKGQHLSDELKFAIAKGIFYVDFKGHVIERAVKYGLFYLKTIEINKEKNKSKREFLMSTRLITESLSSNHLDIFRRGGINRLLVGGTTNRYKRECTELSSHWKKIIDFQQYRENPFYELGKRFNELLFRHYR
jgi:hypothetical protein